MLENLKNDWLKVWQVVNIISLMGMVLGGIISAMVAESGILILISVTGVISFVINAALIETMNAIFETKETTDRILKTIANSQETNKKSNSLISETLPEL